MKNGCVVAVVGLTRVLSRTVRETDNEKDARDNNPDDDSHDELHLSHSLQGVEQVQSARCYGDQTNQQGNDAKGNKCRLDYRCVAVALPLVPAIAHGNQIPSVGAECIRQGPDCSGPCKLTQ